MKRRDVVRALLTPDPREPQSAPPADEGEKPVRVASHAVRAMGLEIGRLADEAREASVLRARLESGTVVVELTPDRIDPSFAADRLARTGDAEYRRLVESMRTTGQQVPILVRPHPEDRERYQVAYGHRRWEAAAELGISVKAIVREMSDHELVVAQGKENAERRNLTFIERALFAAHLDARGFDRATLNAALNVHTAEMTRLLSVAASVPPEIVRAIGPAPKAGRPRWMALAAHLAQPGKAEAVNATLELPAFQTFGSDRRFEAVMDAVRRSGEADGSDAVRNRRGDPVIRVERVGRVFRLVVDERLAPGLGAFLMEHIQDLVRRFEDERGAP